MSKIILHIGHPKTGSSYIQSALAVNEDNLLRQGIYYPAHPKNDHARSGRITSGNVPSSRNLLDAALRESDRHPHATILYSNEVLARRVLQDQALYRELSSKFDLQLILYIRNPVSHAVSAYQQSVKRGGFTGTIGHFLTKTYNLPMYLSKLISFLGCLDIKLDIVNYSNHYDDILDSFFTRVGLHDKSIVEHPLHKLVNRSLTNSELLVQKLFNKHYGRTSSRFVSDVLCNEIPDIKSETPFFSREEYQHFVERIQQAVDEVNKRVAEEEALVIESYPFESDQGYDDVGVNEICLTPSQVEAIVKATAQRVRDSDQLRRYVNTLRDIALELEKDPQYNVEVSRDLMQIAHILRPNGPLIKKKIEEYENSR